MTIKKRRMVHLTWNSASYMGSVYGYTYQDLAELFGMTVESVRQAASIRRYPSGTVRQPLFDPSDLESVFNYWLRKKGTPDQIERDEYPRENKEAIELARGPRGITS